MTADDFGSSAKSELTIGLDLGDRWSYCCVLKEADGVLLEQKRGHDPESHEEGNGAEPDRCG
jgi:hypothetical protein